MKTVTKGFSRRIAESLHVRDEREQAWETVDALVQAVNAHDTYTGGHSHRVAHVAADLARLLGCSQEQIVVIRQGGLVHDVGKVGVPEALLQKRGALTDEELHLMRLHPIMGASILSRMSGLQRLVPIVLHHHEHWDGQGYPSGLAEVDIPLEARIIAICDAYDAMVSETPGGKGYTSEEALAEMRRCSGTQFDPLLVDAMHEAYRNGLLAGEPGSIVLPESGWSVAF